MCWSTRSATISASATRTWKGSRSRVEHTADVGAQLRQGHAFEPGVVPRPADRVPTRMRQHKILREKIAPSGDYLGHRASLHVRQVIIDGVAPDQQRKLDS